MGIIIRQSFKSTVVSLTGAVLGAVSMLWISPKFLTQEQIGTITFIETLTLSLAGLGSLGVYYITDKFFPQFRTEDRTHHGYLTFLTRYITIGFLLSVLLLFIFQDNLMSFYREKKLAVDNPFLYVSFLLCFMMYLGLLDTFARAHLRIVVSAINREIVFRVMALIIILFYTFHHYSFGTMVGLRIAAYAVLVGIMFFYLKRLRIQFPRPDFSVITRSTIKAMASYGMVIMAGSLSGILILKLDSLLIPALLDMKKLGIYTIAFYIGGILEIPRKTMVQISTPIIAQAWLKNDKQMLHEIYQKSALNQLIIGSWMFLGIWMNVDFLFQLMPEGESYTTGKYVIFWIALMRLVDMATGLNNEIVLQSKYYMFNLLTAIGLGIVNVLANLWLIPKMGIIGAALAIFLSFLGYNVMRFVFIWIKLGIQPFSWANLQVCVLAGMTYLIVYFMPSMNSIWLDIAIRSICITIVFMGGVLGLRISPDINQIVQKLLHWTGIKGL